MPTRIRLQRKGKKGQPFYHVVVADGRAPRDGKFIERLGTYHPITHPATVDINFDRALYWEQLGASPSDTARSLLSAEGVMLKHHLIKGVAKGALTEEQVEERFNAWKEEKKAKLEQASKEKELTKKEQLKKRIEAERLVKEAREAELAKKRAKDSLKAEEAAEEAAEEVAEEAPEKAAEQAPEKAAEETPKEQAPEQSSEETPAE